MSVQPYGTVSPPPVRGEAGVGKTTLAAALVGDAAAVGVSAAVGRCYDHAETPPYSSWFDLFAQCPPVENAPRHTSQPRLTPSLYREQTQGATPSL